MEKKRKFYIEYEVVTSATSTIVGCCEIEVEGDTVLEYETMMKMKQYIRDNYIECKRAKKKGHIKFNLFVELDYVNESSE